MKQHDESYLKITYLTKNNNTKTKYFKIETGLIKRILDFYFDGLNQLPQEGSDKQDEYDISQAIFIEIIQNVDNNKTIKIDSEI